MARSRNAGALLALLVIVLAYLVLVPLHMSSPLLLQRLLPARASSVLRTYLPSLQKPIATRIPTIRHFSTTNVNMTTKGYDAISFKDAVKNRRSIYSLTKKSPVSDDRIKEIVTQAIRDVPSSFNSQSTRLVVLVKDDHDKFWNIVSDILKAHVPEDKWEHTKQRMDMFSNAYGTILFYEDPEPIKTLQSNFAQYADKFPQWSEHTSAMHQYELWTALEAEGFGANLQHYSPLPDQKAAAEWNIPLEWSLKSQLVFGQPQEGARDQLSAKSEEPIEKRVKFHGF